MTSDEIGFIVIGYWILTWIICAVAVRPSKGLENDPGIYLVMGLICWFLWPIALWDRWHLSKWGEG